MEIGDFSVEKQKDGTFLYKSKELIQPIKAIVKPSYKDKPQFPLIYEIEEKFKKAGSTMITESIVQILKKISR